MQIFGVQNTLDILFLGQHRAFTSTYYSRIKQN